jgi:hypothetical protein
VKIGNILRLFLLFGLCFLLSSCHIFILHFWPTTYTNLNQDPRMESISGKWFELKQDAFLCSSSECSHKTYLLKLVSLVTDPSLPYSIKEYKKDPLNWQNTDSNARSGRGSKDGYYKATVEDIISKGTKLYVAKITQKENLSVIHIEVTAYLDHPKYKDIPISINSLVESPKWDDDCGKFKLNLEVLESY